MLISHLISSACMQKMSEFMSRQRVIAYYVPDKLICDYHLGRNCICSAKVWNFSFDGQD